MDGCGLLLYLTRENKGVKTIPRHNARLIIISIYIIIYFTILFEITPFFISKLFVKSHNITIQDTPQQSPFILTEMTLYAIVLHELRLNGFLHIIRS